MILNERGYAPFVVNLEGSWELALNDLDEACREMVLGQEMLVNWDELTSIERRRRGALLDYSFDPAHERLALAVLQNLLRDLDQELALAMSHQLDTVAAGILSVRNRVQGAADSLGQILVEQARSFQVRLTPLGRSDPENEPLNVKTLRTLLVMIGLLAKDRGLDVNRHAASAAVIKHMADSAGLTIGETTIESYIKQVPDALESRRAIGR